MVQRKANWRGERQQAEIRNNHIMIALPLAFNTLNLQLKNIVEVSV